MLREAYGVKRIIIRTGKTDLRFGIDKLAALVRMEFGLDPLDAGTLFLFCGKKRDRIKGLVYEGDGFLLLTKRLTKGAFQWPRSETEAHEMSREDYGRLMDGYTVESSIKVYSKIEDDASEPDKPHDETANGGAADSVTKLLAG